MTTQKVNGVDVQDFEKGTEFGGPTIGTVLESNDVIPLTEYGMARTAKDTGSGIALGGAGSYILPAATASALGGVKAGTGVTIAGDGTITIPAATTAVLGTVKKAVAVPNAAAAPTQAEFNALLAALRTAGVLTP